MVPSALRFILIDDVWHLIQKFFANILDIYFLFSHTVMVCYNQPSVTSPLFFSAQSQLRIQKGRALGPLILVTALRKYISATSILLIRFHVNVQNSNSISILLTSSHIFLGLPSSIFLLSFPI